jgi:hypothetical protein
MSRLTRDLSPETYVVNPDTSSGVTEPMGRSLPLGAIAAVAR